MLAYLAPRLTDQVENLATDALLYLFRSHAEVSNTFFNLLSDIGCELPQPLEFDTQLSLENGAIPDLQGRTEKDEIGLLVEVKFGAQFTPNQPLAYIEHIGVEEGGAVIVLAPANRYKYLWKEMDLKCREIGIEPSIYGVDPPQWATMYLEKKLILGFISWSLLFDRFILCPSRELVMRCFSFAV
jgi:hypothetical protein